jgi:sigma-B regulation protein RsbU (phosphoserine phosphatase)
MIELELYVSGQSQPLQLSDGEHSVGRARENDVQIAVARVSKRHAMLRVEGERLYVRDLGSTNGTDVDGRRVGTEEAEVLADATVSFAGALVRRKGSAALTMATPQVGALSSLLSYNIRDGYSEAARARIMDVSSDLFELLASEQNSKEVGAAACRFVARCIRADRVVLLEDQGEGTAVQATSRWSHEDHKGAPLRLSSTIVGQVLSRRDSVLVANPLEDPNYTGQESIMALSLHSAMAAPLFDNQRVRGILYADTARADVRYDEDDLQVLTATANAVAVKLRNLTFEKELRTAAQLQRAMVPENPTGPEGYELEAHQVMCRTVGGDLYQCLPRPDGSFVFALGDVAGKGMPAALAMAATIVLVRMLTELVGDLEDLSVHLNRQLCRSIAREQFVTMFLGELDGATGRLRYVNAGHDAPLLVRPNGGFDQLESTGLPMGLLEDVRVVSAEAVLEPGDLLAVYSDGIPEATIEGKEFLGPEAVKEILVERRSDELGVIRENIVSRVEEFLGGSPSSDDVTLLLLRRKPAS